MKLTSSTLNITYKHSLMLAITMSCSHVAYIYYVHLLIIISYYIIAMVRPRNFHILVYCVQSIVFIVPSNAYDVIKWFIHTYTDDLLEVEVDVVASSVQGRFLGGFICIAGVCLV